MVETDLQSTIGGLSEEGRSNAGVCVLGGVRKSVILSHLLHNYCTQPKRTTQTESDCMCHPNPKTNLQYLIPFNYLTVLMSCEIQLYSTLTTKRVASILCKQVNVSSLTRLLGHVYIPYAFMITMHKSLYWPKLNTGCHGNPVFNQLSSNTGNTVISSAIQMIVFPCN